MSLIDSVSLPRSFRLPRVDGLIQWIVPLVIIAIWQVASVTGFVPTRVLPAPSDCLLYTSPSPRDGLLSRMPSSA